MRGACGHLPRFASASCSSLANSTYPFERQPVLCTCRRKLSTASRFSDELPMGPFSNRLSVGNLTKQPKDELSAIQTLQGFPPRFTKGQTKARLLLSPDRFPLDDELPLIAPQPKTLAFFPSPSPALEELSKKLTRALAPLELAHDTSSADLSLVSYDPLDPILPAGNAVVFVNDSTKPGAYLRGGILAERHPLMDGLNWQTLLVRESLQLERTPDDTVLLWQDTRPLIFL